MRPGPRSLLLVLSLLAIGAAVVPFSVRQPGRPEPPLPSVDDSPPRSDESRVLARPAGGGEQVPSAPPTVPSTPLTIRAIRAEDGTPIERFGFARGISDPLPIADRPGGVLKISFGTTGRRVITVFPPSESGLAPATRVFHCIVGVPETVLFNLHPVARRTIEIVDASGEPVAGARVGLREFYPWPRPLDEDRVSDSDGRVELAGSPGRPFTLQALAPGYAPGFVRPFRIDGPGVVRVVVHGGATLRGKIVPESLIARLYEDAVIPGWPGRQSTPELLLSNGDECFPPRFAEVDALTVEKDGSFVFTDLPAGEWRVRLWFHGPHSSEARTIATGVVLEARRESELRVDLTQWVPRRVELRLTVDDEPFDGGLHLWGELPVAAEDGRRQRFERASVPPEAEGAVALELEPAVWSPALRARFWQSTAVFRPEPFVVEPGKGAQVVEIHVRSAHRTLRLLDPRGHPARDIELLVEDEGGKHVGAFRTGSFGTVTLYGPPGRVNVRCRRLPLQSEQNHELWRRRVPYGRRNDAFVELGAFDLVPDGGATYRVRLPDEWRHWPD